MKTSGWHWHTGSPCKINLIRRIGQYDDYVGA